MNNCSLEYINSAKFNLDIRKHFVKLSAVKNIVERQNKFAEVVKEFTEPYLKTDRETIELLISRMSDVLNASFRGAFNTNNIPAYMRGETPDDINTDEPVEKVNSFEYLDNMYGQNENLKHYADTLNSKNLTKFTLVNMEEGYEIYDDKDLNESLIRYQEELFDVIKDYLINNIKIHGEEKIILDNINIFENFHDIDSLVQKYLPKDNVGIYFEKKYNANNAAFVNAFISYVTLNYFDEYILSKRGSYIKINKKNLRGKLSNDLNKYHFEGVGSKMSNNWENDAEKDKKTLADTTSDRLRHVVESFKVYKQGRNIPEEFESFNLITLYSTVQKINNLIYDYRTKDVKFDLVFEAKNMVALSQMFTDAEWKAIEGKTFYDILTTKEDNSLIYWSILMKLLNLENISSEDFCRENFNSDDRKFLYTIYKNVFDTKGESLKNVVNNNPYKYKTYYSMVVKAMSDVGSSEYLQSNRDETNDITVKTLKDISTAKTRSRIERNINSVNSKLNVSKFNSLTLNYKPEYKENDKEFIFTVGDYVATYNPTDRNLSFELNGNKIDAFDFKLEHWNDLKDFVGDLLNLPFNDLTFYDNFKNAYSITGTIQPQELFELLKVASSVFFNNYFSNTVLEKATSLSNVKNKTKQHYEKMFSKIYFSSAGNKGIQIKAITKKDLVQLSRVATAYDITSGTFVSGLYKDGSGNPIASIVTNRLADRVLQQFNQLIKPDKSNPASHFILMNNTILFNGISYLRDYTDGYEAKKATQFNAKEFFDNAFVVNYLTAKRNGDLNPIFRIFPDAVSDKPQVLHVTVNGGAIINDKLFKNYNATDIKNLAKEELGKFYAKSLTNILGDFKMLENWLNNDEIINPLSNFKEFNDKYGNDAVDIFNSYILAYNKEFPQNPLKFTDQIHFFNNKGKLAFGRGLLAEIKKNGVSKNTLFEIFKDSYGNDLANIWLKDTLNLLDNYDDNETFWKKQEARFLLDLMRINYSLDYIDDRGKEVKLSAIKSIAVDPEWSNRVNGKIILGKIKYADGTVLNISSVFDFEDLNYLTTKENGESIIAHYKDSEFDLNEYLKLNNATLELHPEFATFNSMNYFIGEEYILSTVGTHYNHDGKGSVNSADFSREEAFRIAAARKRAVSQTANTATFGRNLVDGGPSDYTVAVMKDPKIQVYNLMGDEDTAKYLDGCTLVSPETVYLENNALRGDVVGMDKKTFVHFYDAKTGTGGIIKTACFAITNERIRNSADFSYNENGQLKRMQILKSAAKLLMQHKWENLDTINILKDFNGNDIEYNTNFGFYDKYERIYFQGFSEYGEGIEAGSNYEVISITKSDEPGFYEFKVREVDTKGEAVDNNSFTINKYIDSNYAFWQAFGGEYALELNENNNLIPSEASIRNLTTACINVGRYKNPNFKYNGDAITASDLIQPLKNASIQYLVTEGAIKQGGGNFNEFNSIYNPNGTLNTFKFKILNAGVQLNAEHHADDSSLSLMTQVYNALSARNYNTELADEVYEATKAMIEFAIEGFTDEFQRVLDRNDKKFKDSLVTVIIESLMNKTARDGNLLASLAEDIIRNFKRGNVVDSNAVEGSISYSLPSVYKQIITLLTSSFTKKGIKFKFKGILAVLNPSVNLYKIYGGRLRSSFNSYEDILKLQQEKYDKEPLHLSEIRVGRKYKVYDKSTKNFIDTIDLSDLSTVDTVNLKSSITSPRRYWNAKDKYYDETRYAIYEDITSGNNLASYDFNFTGIEFVGSKKIYKKYHMLDLAVIKALYNFNIDAKPHIDTLKIDPNNEDAKKSLDKFFNRYELKKPENYIYYTRKKLYTELQNQLNAISKHEYDRVKVLEHNNKGEEFVKTVILKDLKVNPYELIMPMIYASKFGLEVNDDLHAIQENNNFFVERLLNKWDTISDSNFHIALKRLNGKHIYLKNSSIASAENYTLVDNFQIIKRDGKVFRVDLDGNVMYELASETDKVYKAENDEEFIMTDNIHFYLNNRSFNSIKISDEILKDTNKFENIYRILVNSEVEEVVNYLDMIADTITNENGDLTNLLTIKQTIKNLNNIKLDINSLLESKDSFSKYFIKIGRNIHTSFLQSLKILAARIPAQSMQSFMAMKVVGFDKSNLNSAYVSHFQFWLQGSDLDIDKVSLLGYEFSNNGEFLGWSPYFKLNNSAALESSLNLPFPTGKDTEIKVVNNLNSAEADFLKKVLNFDTKTLRWENDEISSEAYKEFSKFIRKINKEGIKVTEEFVKKLMKSPLYKAINIHNKWLLSRKGKYKRDARIKNFVSYCMFKISGDPISVIQSQSPIDEPVKILKDKGNSSKTEKYDTMDLFGNYMTVVKGFRKNQISKDCVAISASGMKNFEGEIHYFGKTLLESPEKAVNLLANVDVCGSTYKLLANTYIPQDVLERYKNYKTNNEYLNNYIQELVQALENVDQENDALLIISAVLGAAVDNAKDPILGKINGGSSMLPLYIYGITMGIPFEVLSDCMMSDTARNITSLMEGNIIQDLRDRSFKDAYDYIMDGVSNINKETENTLKNIFKLNENNSLENFILQNSKQELLRIYNESENSEVLVRRALENLIIWKNIHILATTEKAKGKDGNDYLVIESLKTLYEGSREMSKARPIFNLNKQIDTDVNKIINFINSFNTIFSDRYDLMDNLEKRKKKFFYLDGVAYSSSPKQIMEEFKNHPFTFDEYINNENYRKNVIAKYNVFKHSVNILESFDKDPHYLGFMKVMKVSLETIRSSAKFRYTEKYASKVFKDNHIKTNQKLNTTKAITQFFDIAINNKWLRDSKTIISLPTKFINKNSKSLNNGIVLLGTDKGNEAFKQWMDFEVIPSIKKGYIDDKFEYSLKINKFINDLQEMEINKTELGNINYAIAPSVDTMPRTPTAKEEYQKIKTDFNKLFTNAVPTYKGYNLGELFFLYNLIVFNMGVGQNTYTNLFEDVLNYKSFDMAADYIKFSHSVDNSYNNLVEDVDFTYDELLKFTAPATKLYKATGKYVKVKNFDTLSWEIYRKKDINNNSENIYEFEDNFENPDMGYEDDYNDENYSDFNDDFDTEYDNTKTNDSNDRYEKVIKYSCTNPWSVLNRNKNYEINIDKEFSVITGNNFNVVLRYDKNDGKTRFYKINTNNTSYYGNKLLTLLQSKGIDDVVTTEIFTDKNGTKSITTDKTLTILINALTKTC